MLLRQLEYFVAVVECNSFTEAAERCFISQSEISQQISALEKELGVQLIKRENLKFSLTAAGEYFYKSGRAILSDVNAMKNETVRIGSDDELHLNLGYLAGYDGFELPETIMEFSKIYPEVIVTVLKVRTKICITPSEAGRRILRLATNAARFPMNTKILY